MGRAVQQPCCHVAKSILSLLMMAVHMHVPPHQVTVAARLGEAGEGRGM